MKNSIIILGLSFLMSTVSVAQTAEQKIEMKIDALGNAAITLTMEMNAQQWNGWSRSYGNNPAAMKRQMERSMPQFFLGDFKLDKDDMNRSFTFNVTAYGVCDVDKRGKWSLDTDRKSSNITELTDSKYMLVSTLQESGATIQQTFIVEFPEEVENIKIDKNAFDETVFAFEMDSPTSNTNYIQLSGWFLLIFGGVWLGKDVMFNGKQSK